MDRRLRRGDAHDQVHPAVPRPDRRSAQEGHLPAELDPEERSEPILQVHLQVSLSLSLSL